MKQPYISTREVEILEKLSNGMSTDQIANTLFISVHTVRTHRKNILRKLGVHNTLMAARLFINGEIDRQESAEAMLENTRQQVG